ncbi:hypothetical protein ACJRO7_004394 [Eucalyptus globulus]|uniref:Alpha/beta hydrolase fold-3 domain-containing protein n=1 Tax=Eucalyptus globulus TaxID=34317 RepID=A0ABD3J2C7_EUCGL
MASLSFDARLNLQLSKSHQQQQSLVLEEIEGLIRVYKDGRVERFPIIPSVSCTISSGVDTHARDVTIDKFTNLWARVYVPNRPGKYPLLVYFHGGGFCVGSAAWSCYHEFLANLASTASCVIVSVNYRLAPENRLPAAYEDGVNAIMWLKRQVANGSDEHKWWVSQCNLSNFFLVGDSAGANIAFNVAVQLGNISASVSNAIKPLHLKGVILIQPFFGGEIRTGSEKMASQPPNSALTLSASDTYWRLSLPSGANRDHPWCNPLSNRINSSIPSAMVCISELDILKDRNSQLCNALANMGKAVEMVMYRGVGHAFQVLHKSQMARSRTQEMISDIKAFINQ